MPIPKIFHQTGKTADISEPYRTFRRRLQNLHPSWNYRFYDDAQCRDIVKQDFPTLLPVYDAYPYSIQRADLFRFIIVHLFGGFYLDLDVECIQAIDDLCEYNCVFGEESRLTAASAAAHGHRNRVRVANYMFGSRKGHPLLLHILSRMITESGRNIRTENDILKSTGPGLVTRVFFEHHEIFKDVVLLENKDRRCGSPYHDDVGCHFGDYARHLHAGSWRHVAEKKRKIPGRRPSIHLCEQLRSEMNAQIQKITLPEKIHILKTYTEEIRDGLAGVFQRASDIGTISENTKYIAGKKVLICGVPFLYPDRISPLNTNVIYTTFESTKLPEGWVKTINGWYDHCIVPHQAVRDVFIQSGIYIPITVIQQGFPRYKRSKWKSKGMEPFRVGFLGVAVKRKNLIKLFHACTRLRPKIPQIKLVVHVPHYYDWFDPSPLEEIRSSPFVEWSEGFLSEDAIGEWYHRLSCYVYPSSGEGWSFTPRESLYLGVPTLISDIPVHAELIQSGYYGTLQTAGLESADFEGNAFGQWHRVEVAAIEKAVLDLYRHYGEYQVRALQGSRWIEKRWPNYRMQQQLLNFLWNLPLPQGKKP